MKAVMVYDYIAEQINEICEKENVSAEEFICELVEDYIEDHKE